MEGTNKINNDKSALERHFQTVLLAVITAALIGGFSKITNMSDTMIVIKEQAISNREIINGHTEKINRLETNDAGQTQRIIKLEMRVQDIKEKIDERKK